MKKALKNIKEKHAASLSRFLFLSAIFFFLMLSYNSL